MTDALNYWRDLRFHLSLAEQGQRGAASYGAFYVSSCAEMKTRGDKAVKFTLPEDGVILESYGKALKDALNLPFPSVLLEYPVQKGMPTLDGRGKVERGAVLAWDQDTELRFMWALGIRKLGWSVQPYLGVMRKTVTPGANGGNFEIGYVDLLSDMAPIARARVPAANPDMCMFPAVCVIVELLDALSCRNVVLETVPAKPLTQRQAKWGVLPYDEYKVLTLDVPGAANTPGDGTHGGRSPREHLRRGHIRRLPEHHVWVNSTVVNAGAAGKIHKSYKVGA